MQESQKREDSDTINKDKEVDNHQLTVNLIIMQQQNAKIVQNFQNNCNF